MPTKQSLKKKVKQDQTLKSKSDYRYIAMGVLGILGIVYYYYTQAFSFIQDDSFITYRYVKNFTEGNGLVFNMGDKVEGYTCFLWVMLLSFTKLLGFNFISLSQSLGIIFSLLTLFFTYQTVVQIFTIDKNSFTSIALGLSAVILIVGNGAVAYWAVSGMETGMFMFLITLGIYLYLKESRKQDLSIPFSSLVFLLASLTRPEGNLIFVLTLIHKFFIVKKTSEDSKIKNVTKRMNLIWLGIYIIPAIIFFIWRYSYYGDIFPNTFYAKTGSPLEYLSTGLDYFWEFAKTYALYGILIVVGFLSLRSKEYFKEYLYLAILFVMFSIYIIYIGGDVLRPSRFFVPIVPLLSIFVVGGISHLIGIIIAKKTASISAAILIITTSIISYYSYKQPYDTIKKYSELENGLVDKMKLTAQWLKNKQTQSGKTLTVAVTTIGALSYYSEVNLIDMLGLTDKTIAHNPQPISEISSANEIGWKEKHYNVEYVMSRKPDYIYFSTGIKPSAYAERGLFTSEEFIKNYYAYYFSMKEYGFTDAMYKRKTNEEIQNTKQMPPNPNYKKSFVNVFNQAMNTMKDKNKVQEAINLYKQSANEGPSGWGAPYQMIGDLYSQQKNNDMAFENYKKAIEMDDHTILAHYYLYQIYSSKGDTVNAKISLEKLNKFAPDLMK